jgi:hypothetical protein
MNNLSPAAKLFWNVGQLTEHAVMDFDEAVQQVINEQFEDYTEGYRADLYSRLMTPRLGNWSLPSIAQHIEEANG